MNEVTTAVSLVIGAGGLISVILVYGRGKTSKENIELLRGLVGDQRTEIDKLKTDVEALTLQHHENQEKIIELRTNINDLKKEKVGLEAIMYRALKDFLKENPKEAAILAKPYAKNLGLDKS